MARGQGVMSPLPNPQAGDQACPVSSFRDGKAAPGPVRTPWDSPGASACKETAPSVVHLFNKYLLSAVGLALCLSSLHSSREAARMWND